MALYPSLGLNNILIGGAENHRVGIAFKARFSSPLAAVRFYTINQNPVGHPGYAGGSGGRYKYELYADAAGVPGAPLAAGVLLLDAEYTEWINLGGFPLIGFPTFPLLDKGKWYHFVVTNIDAQPTTNYISLDVMIGVNKINPDPDSYVEYSDATGGKWTKYASMIASPFGAFYANGELQGNGGYQLSSTGATQCGKSYGFGKLC